MAAWIAFTPNQARAAFLQWLVGGTIFVATALYWLPEAAALRLGVSYTGGLLAAATIILWDALRFGVFGYLVGWLRPRGYRTVIAWPIAWVALEYVWPHVFPWRLGQTQLGWLPLCQVAELAGVYGISFLLVWASASVGLWARQRRVSPAEPDAAGWKSAAIASFSIAVASGWGCWRMADVERSSAASSRLRVGLVQPGARGDRMAELLRSQSLAIAGDADLVVWGEGAIGEFPLSLMSFGSPQEIDSRPGFPHQDAAPFPGLGRPLLCGGGSYVTETGRRGSLRNTAYLIDSNQAVLGRYHKRALMPWGEYAVGQDWIPGMRRLLGDIDELVPGTSAAPLSLPGRGRLGVLICYEDLTAETACQTVREGGQVLINLNNLSAFGDTPAAVQHQRLAVFRAIENRRWLVRCGTTGSTAIVAATGKVEQQAPLREPAILVASVPLLERHTFYTALGDLVAAALAGLAAVLCFGAGWPRANIRDACRNDPFRGRSLRSATGVAPMQTRAGIAGNRQGDCGSLRTGAH